MVFKKIALGIGLMIIAIGFSLYAAYGILTQDLEFGGDPLEQRAELLIKADNFRDGHFHNTVKESDVGIWTNIKDRYQSKDRFPPGNFPIVKPQFHQEIKPGLRAYWFGHASVLVEIDGYRVFFDPMLSEFAFPVHSLAPQRQNPPPLRLKELPQVHAVLISHDHYDHLDMHSVKHLADQGAMFYVGYGVGAHLEKWGIKASQVKEMKWGDSAGFNSLTINCTEARHYSGRKAMSRDTLWASWVVEGPGHTVFHSGDTGYSAHFKQIGERFKKIDLSLIKVGDYGLDMQWQDIHMVPESSVQAHIDIGAKVMLPIHWGVFVLSNHPWDEPIERAAKAAEEKGAYLVTPRLGEEYSFGQSFESHRWWRSLKGPSH